jgi:hypothetical protein
MENTASTLSQQGMTAFAAEKFEDAADFFQKAADAYQQNEQSLEAAEARNNLSVALVNSNVAKKPCKPSKAPKPSLKPPTMQNAKPWQWATKPPPSKFSAKPTKPFPLRRNRQIAARTWRRRNENHRLANPF